MIARGALGNPWIFGEIGAALSLDEVNVLRRTGALGVDNEGRGEGEKPISPVLLRERIALAREHCNGLALHSPGRLVSMRRHLAWYFKGMKHAARIRREVNRCVTLGDYLGLLDQIEAWD
jgi:tRNA-dihydrouridine synthase B